MTIFNSLGSNYDFSFVLKTLFAKNKQSFHSDLKKFLEKKYGGTAILAYKGREAIGLALNILKLKLPKESFVAINGFTCFAVYKAIENEGYQPECLDIDNPLDLNFSPEILQKSLKKNPNIKAVIIQNTLGYPCDIEEIAKVCHENNLILIEDLAHCVGTKYKDGKEAGTIGDFVVLSFSQDKIIDAVSGGALIIRNTDLVGRARKTYTSTSPRRWRGSDLDSFEVDNNNATMQQCNNVNLKQQLLDRFYPLSTFIIRKTYPIILGRLIHFILKSLNLLSKPMNEGFYTTYDLPNWYAYLAIDAFTDLNINLKHRRKIASIYNSILDKKITSSFINKNIPLSSNLRYPIFVENRKSLIDHLKKQGVYISDIWYDSVDNNLKNAKEAADKILNLPTHRNVSETDAKNIAQEINEWLEKSSKAFIRHSGEPRQTRRLQNLHGSERFWTGQNDGIEVNPRVMTRKINNKSEWEGFLSKHPEANFLQSWYWGEFYEVLGNKVQRTGFYINGKLAGVMLSITEPAKRGMHLIVPGGPIIDWENNELVNAFVQEIKKIAKDNKCVFVRVRPQLVSDEFSKNLFKKNGFINGPMHLHAELTSQLDIAKAEETLLSQMRKTTRYEIKKAISQGIKITSSKDPIAIKKFYELQIETAKRQKFVPFSYEFLYEQFKVFAENSHALLYEAKLEKTLLAQAFIIFYGKEAVYHYGASTDEGRKYPGAYLIQWEAIKEAKRRGVARYNFWGVAPENKPDHRFYGLSLFKRGFGGQDVEYLHAQDLVINYPRYIINYVVETIRKKVRNV